MEFDIKEFKNEYLNYLKSSFNGENLEDHYEITLPLFDRFNDALQIYIEESKQNKNEYLITDDSYIINSLIGSGFSMSEKRINTIQSICSKVGVKLDGDQLVIYSTRKDVINKVHALAQAMLRVDDMYLTAQSRIVSYFLDDIIDYFKKSEIYYTNDVSFVGKSGLTHGFDFLFKKIEVILKGYVRL